MIEKQTSYGDSKFWRFVNLAGNTIGANLFFILCCLPVVTIGPATCGLYSAIRYLIRKESWFQGFLEGFKKHFVRSMIAGLLVVGAMVYLLLNFNVAFNFYTETGDFMPMITSAIPMLFPTLLAAALWPLNIYVPYNTMDWLKNAVNLIVKAPLMVLASAALWWFPVFFILYFIGLAAGVIIVFLGIYFALCAFVSTILLKDTLVYFLNLYRAEHPEELPETNKEGE